MIKNSSYLLSKDCIVIGDLDGMIRIIDLNRCKIIHKQKLHDAPIFSICALDKDKIVCGAQGNKLKIWNTNDPTKCFSINAESSTCLLKLNDHQFVMGAASGGIQLFDSNTGQCVHTFEGYPSANFISNPVTKLILLPCNCFASLSYDSTTIRIWEASNKKCIATIDCGDTVADMVYVNGSIYAGLKNGVISEFKVTLANNNTNNPVLLSESNNVGFSQESPEGNKRRSGSSCTLS